MFLFSTWQWFVITIGAILCPCAIITLLLANEFKSSIYLFLGIILTGMFLFMMSFCVRSNLLYSHENNQVEKIEVKKLKEIDIYMNLNKVKYLVNKSYDDNFSNKKVTDYNYDYLNITLSTKKMSLFQFVDCVMHKDFNILYDSECKINKVTEKLTLEGILKTDIKNGETHYLINNYILYDDDEQKIKSLANNQEVRIDIVYDKEQLSNGKEIKKYSIVNAKTK